MANSIDAGKAEKLKLLRAKIAEIDADTELGDTHGHGSKRKAQRDRKAAEPQKPEAQRAYDRVLSLCSRNEFCRAKMAERLKREGFGELAARNAIDKAVSVGLIDDIRWGEMRIAGLMHNGRGIVGIERELRENGIEADAIEGWPYVYSERYGSEIERALHVLEAAPPRSKDPRSSAYARLVRKGYSPGIASQAARTWFEERNTR